MSIRRFLAVSGAVAALGLILAGGAFAAGTTVSVRVEGKKRTLLPATVAHTTAGSITKAGAPPGNCPSTSAAGALDVATHHRWGAIYSTSFSQLELTSILGEKWTFSSPNYWGVWVDNRYATTGMCQIKLRKGDRILFAVDSGKHHEHPLGVKAARHVRVGHRLRVKVVSYTDGGAAKPLAGVRIHGATTNGAGFATITPTRSGRLRLTASHAGYIRSAAVSVKVLG
jgi:hypothetical protein